MFTLELSGVRRQCLTYEEPSRQRDAGQDMELEKFKGLFHAPISSRISWRKRLCEAKASAIDVRQLRGSPIDAYPQATQYSSQIA